MTTTTTTKLTPAQSAAIRLVVGATMSAIKAAGPEGCPAGPLYLAMQEQGCTHAQLEALMGGLVKAGALRREGNVYFIA